MKSYRHLYQMGQTQKIYLSSIHNLQWGAWANCQIRSLASSQKYRLSARYRIGTRSDGPPKLSQPTYLRQSKMKQDIWTSWNHFWVTFIMEPGPSQLCTSTSFSDYYLFDHSLELTHSLFFVGLPRFHNGAIIFFAVAASHYVTLFGGGWSSLVWEF